MRISDWSSDVCSSDLSLGQHPQGCGAERGPDRRTGGGRRLKRCGSTCAAARVGAMNRGKGVTRTLHKAWLLLLALVLAALSLPAFALGLGQIPFQSDRGDPLLTSIAIMSSDPCHLEHLPADRTSGLPAKVGSIRVVPG